MLATEGWGISFLTIIFFLALDTLQETEKELTRTEGKGEAKVLDTRLDMGRKLSAKSSPTTGKENLARLFFDIKLLVGQRSHVLNNTIHAR